MARYPGALWRPITASKARPRITPRRVNLHVAVSEAASLHGYFNAPGRVDSHFYVRKDGTVEQYVDTSVQAWADLQGNPTTISVETQGGVTNAQGEPWTSAQVKALADLFAWCAKVHDIPMRLATDSRPGASSHGLSWHRLGIDGNFPGGLLKGRISGGLRYSNARGKICPGNAKIQQIPGILARAKQIAGGTSSPLTPSAPSGAVTAMLADLDYPDVRTAQADLGLVIDGIAGPLTTKALENEMSKLDEILDRVTKTNHAVGRIEPIVRALGGLKPGDDISAEDIAQIKRRSEQTNAAVGRIEKAIGTYGQAKGA